MPVSAQKQSKTSAYSRQQNSSITSIALMLSDVRDFVLAPEQQRNGFRRDEQCIGNRVQQCVGVRMTEQTAAVRDRDTAEDQFASRHQGVAVITLADAKWKWIHAR